VKTDTMPKMNRRHFIKTAASSLLFSCAVPAPSAAPDWTPLPSDHFFYDDRFVEALQLACRMSPSGRLTPVQGDITGIWKAGLDREWARAPLTMRGVTTESFYFCLKVMTASKADVETSVARVGPDLFLWTIRSAVNLNTGLPG
jgi:hypothetical protein